MDLKPTIPRYCRVNRVVRDIPSTNVVEGNRRTSLRQDAQRVLAAQGLQCRCVRCREVRGHPVEPDQLQFDDLAYAAGGAEEHFMAWVTPDDRLAGYLRLSLPGYGSPATDLPDLKGAALIREVHVVGPSMPVGRVRRGAAQHSGLGSQLSGLGSQLIDRAERLAQKRGYPRMAIIASLGTRAYYRRLGYRIGDTYMLKDLADSESSLDSESSRGLAIQPS